MAKADLVRMKEISERTGIPRGTLSTWRTRGKIAPHAAGVYSWRKVRPVLVEMVTADGSRRGQGVPTHLPIEDWPI